MIDKEFLRGCELWIAPDIINSPWRWTLEWSLNFQIAKSIKHQPQQISESFKNLMIEVESSEFVQILIEESPWTMISAESLLPAKWFLLSGPLTKEQFQKSLDDTWIKLGSPSTRIFASKSWTKDMIEGLKSKCIKDSSTEVFEFNLSE